MTITFKCGHSMKVPRDVKSATPCAECGERIVARVSDATPTFKGSCTGPLVQKVSA